MKKVLETSCVTCVFTLKFYVRCRNIRLPVWKLNSVNSRKFSCIFFIFFPLFFLTSPAAIEFFLFLLPFFFFLHIFFSLELFSADIGPPRLFLQFYLYSYFLSRLRVTQLCYPISQISLLFSELSK